VSEGVVKPEDEDQGGTAGRIVREKSDRQGDLKEVIERLLAAGDQETHRERD
jgi:hypothetical protein